MLEYEYAKVLTELIVSERDPLLEEKWAALRKIMGRAYAYKKEGTRLSVPQNTTQRKRNLSFGVAPLSKDHWFQLVMRDIRNCSASCSQSKESRFFQRILRMEQRLAAMLRKGVGHKAYYALCSFFRYDL